MHLHDNLIIFTDWYNPAATNYWPLIIHCETPLFWGYSYFRFKCSIISIRWFIGALLLLVPICWLTRYHQRASLSLQSIGASKKIKYPAGAVWKSMIAIAVAHLMLELILRVVICILFIALFVEAQPLDTIICVALCWSGIPGVVKQYMAFLKTPHHKPPYLKTFIYKQRWWTIQVKPPPLFSCLHLNPSLSIKLL